MRQYQGKDLDAYVKSFHEKALGCCNLVADDMVVDVCLHGMIGTTEFIWRICHSLFLSKRQGVQMSVSEILQGPLRYQIHVKEEANA